MEDYQKNFRDSIVKERAKLKSADPETVKKYLEKEAKGWWTVSNDVVESAPKDTAESAKKKDKDTSST